MGRTCHFPAKATAVLAACLLIPASCLDDDHDPYGELPEPCARAGQPDFTGSGRGVIGPEGGTVEVTDPDSGLQGVRVEVPPGAWSECWEVRVAYASIFDTPNYPSGYVPFERPDPSGAVRIEIGLSTTWDFYDNPDPLPVRLSFPLDHMRVQPGPRDIRAVFFHDDARDTWRIVLPDPRSGLDRVSVRADDHRRLWSWGLVDLEDVDYEDHLLPALEDRLGSGTVADIESRMEEIRAEAERRAREQDWKLDCAGLGLAEAFFQAMRDSVYDMVDNLQRSLGCGECNPLTERFREEFWIWQGLNWGIDLVGGAFTKALQLDELVGLAVDGLLEVVNQDCVSPLLGFACDFDCYFESRPPLMVVLQAVYLGCDQLRGAFRDFATRAMNPPCP